MPTLEQLKKFFANTIEAEEKALEKFKNSLERHAVHAFTWAESTMKASARAMVARHYLGSITAWEEAHNAGTLDEVQPQTPEEVVENIREAILNQAIRRNSNISRSTSVTSNFMEQEENAFYAFIISEWLFIH